MWNIYYVEVARLEFPWFGAIIEQQNDNKVEEQSWFLLRYTTYTKMEQIWQNSCVFWICHVTWKQDFSRVNNRREVKLDKDTWNTSKFKKIKKKKSFQKNRVFLNEAHE